MNYNNILNQYSIEEWKGENNGEKIILVDCMDTIIKRNCSLNGILRKWSAKVAKEFHIYKEFLYGYRRGVILGSMHNRVPINVIYEEIFDQCAYFNILPYDEKERFCIRSHQIEMACEIKSHHIILESVRFLERQKQQGVKVYCVSDFRLSSKDIEKFFLNLKIDSIFDGIFSSSDCGFTKKEGNFYTYVLRILGVSPQMCMMLGDNLQSDCVNASKSGIKAYWKR